MLMNIRHSICVFMLLDSMYDRNMIYDSWRGLSTLSLRPLITAHLNGVVSFLPLQRTEELEKAGSL
jgi:hypothetical protein